MGIAAGVLAVAGTAYSAYSSNEAADAAGDAGDVANEKMVMIIADFMSAWKGTTPDGYQSWDQFQNGGEGKIGIIPGVKKDNPYQQIAIADMQKQGMGIGELIKLKNMATKSKQEAYLSEKWGSEVTLESKYEGGQLEYSTVGMSSEPGTFASLDEIREKGGAPSIEQQYMPWIKPGQDAYEAMSNVILNGDMSGFYTSPGYAFRLAEGEKAIERLQNAGKIPTAQAQEGLIEHSQGLATEEFGNYMGQLNSLSNMGYTALTDLKSLEAYYKSSSASMASGTAMNSLAQDNYQGSLEAEAGNQYGYTISQLGGEVGSLNDQITGTSSYN